MLKANAGAKMDPTQFDSDFSYLLQEAYFHNGNDAECRKYLEMAEQCVIEGECRQFLGDAFWTLLRDKAKAVSFFMPTDDQWYSYAEAQSILLDLLDVESVEPILDLIERAWSKGKMSEACDMLIHCDITSFKDDTRFPEDLVVQYSDMHESIAMSMKSVKAMCECDTMRFFQGRSDQPHRCLRIAETLCLKYGDFVQCAHAWDGTWRNEDNTDEIKRCLKDGERIETGWMDKFRYLCRRLEFECYTPDERNALIDCLLEQCSDDQQRNRCRMLRVSSL